MVIRPGALGDAILTLPVLQSLAAAGARVTAVGHPVFRLAVECGLAAEHVPFDDARLLDLFAEGGSCPLFAGFDLAIAYTRRADPLLVANLGRSGVTAVVAWPAHPEPGLHVTDHLLGALGAAGVEAGERRPTLPPRREWLDAARAWLDERGVGRGFVAVHPGSGGRAKRWPVERFAELAGRLGRPVVWLLGPAEAQDDEARGLGSQVGAVAADVPLPTLVGLLASCLAYVGNDSGVSHLAAAIGAPTLALFGPTDPATWAPRGERVAVLGSPHSGGFESVSVEQALRALGPWLRA
ncbi:MAG TPA: glycosyltransferase family 9 protein [Planctomycetota bacterium]|nr:glycosyltransferase family 9 protein [Planctomycetota bacterium]